jgi:hypothetical protein
MMTISGRPLARAAARRVLDLAGRVRRQRTDARPGVDVDPHDLSSLELADVALTAPTTRLRRSTRGTP